MASVLSAIARLGDQPDLNADHVNIYSAPGEIPVEPRTLWATGAIETSAAAAVAPIAAAAVAPAAPVKAPRAKKEPPAATQALEKPREVLPESASQPMPESSQDEGDAAACAPWSADVSPPINLAPVAAVVIPSDDELRALVGLKIQSGYRADISTLLREHGADSISKIPPGNRSDFKRCLEALGVPA